MDASRCRPCRLPRGIGPVRQHEVQFVVLAPALLRMTPPCRELDRVGAIEADLAEARPGVGGVVGEDAEGPEINAASGQCAHRTDEAERTELLLLEDRGGRLRAEDLRGVGAALRRDDDLWRQSPGDGFLGMRGLRVEGGGDRHADERVNPSPGHIPSRTLPGRCASIRRTGRLHRARSSSRSRKAAAVRTNIVAKAQHNFFIIPRDRSAAVAPRDARRHGATRRLASWQCAV